MSFQETKAYKKLGERYENPFLKLDPKRLTPMKDRIIGRRILAPTRNVIIAPQIAEEKSTRVEVVAIGPGRRDEDGNLEPMQVKPGEVVIIGEYRDFDFGEGLVLFQQDDIRVVEH